MHKQVLNYKGGIRSVSPWGAEQEVTRAGWWVCIGERVSILIYISAVQGGGSLIEGCLFVLFQLPLSRLFRTASFGLLQVLGPVCGIELLLLRGNNSSR